MGLPRKLAYSKGMPARVAILCAVLATAGAAYAEDRRQVAVIDLSGTDSARLLAEALRQELFSHVELKPLNNASFEAALVGGFLDEDRAHIDRAKGNQKEADDALGQLQYTDALRAAGNGMRELTFVMPTSEVLGLCADLAFAAGQAQLGLRKPNEASQYFALAHQLDQSSTPDPTRYEPAIITAYRNAVKKTPIFAKLEIKGTGRVWIDGVERGLANATFETVEGLHVVQLTGAERETRGEVLMVSGAPGQPITTRDIINAPAPEELKLRRARIALRDALDAAALASALKHLTTLLHVSDAVLIRKGPKDKLIVQTWREKAGFSRQVFHDSAKPIALLDPLSPARRTVPGGNGKGPPIVVEKPWYQRTWVLSSGVAAVVVAVVSTIAIATRQRELPPWARDAGWEPQ